MKHPTFGQAQKLAPRFRPPTQAIGWRGDYRSTCTESEYRGGIDGPPRYELIADHYQDGSVYRAILRVNGGEAVYHYRARGTRIYRCDAHTYTHGWDT